MSFGAQEVGNVNELQQRLAQPFDPKYIEWKPGSTTRDGSKCMAMPYADMRAYMERLDELFGMEWSVRYVAWGETRIFCELTINGVTRTSTGESDAQDAKNGLAGTVAEAQAMKRACAMFGLGRYLYDLPSAWVAYDSQNKRISDAGKAELESRYKAWYARQTAQARPQAQQAVSQAQSSTQASKTSQQPATPARNDADAVDGDVLFERDATPAELAIIQQWGNRTEAEMWAVMTGACANEFEARTSMSKSINAHGGKVTKDNYQAIYTHFLRRQQEKLQAQAVAA